MGTPKRRRSDLAGRPAMRSPGRPPAGRLEHRQRFWVAIARGLSSEDAAAEAGVSAAVGVRWFREGGGCRRSLWSRRQGGTCRSPSGRRSRSCVAAAPGCGRSRASSVARHRRSRGNSDATPPPAVVVWSIAPRPAQWHAERRARRPKPAKLAVNPALRRYVQDRLSGAVQRPDGVAVDGPEVNWIGRRHGRRSDRRWARSWSPEQISNRAAPGLPR